MKVVGLISGGKDSCYNLMQCVVEGHDLLALANLRPKDKDELDSYMFQTVGHHAIDLYADALGLPLYRRTLVGTSVERGSHYDVVNPLDEVEDLFELLKEIRDELGVEAVSVGAILSDYQRVRVEHVCGRLGLTALSYMWRRDQQELLLEMINSHVDAIIIKVAALGLDPKKHLGKTIADIYPYMVNMHTKYGLNICGEGGEYETFTLDCPLFRKKIVLDEAETVIHSDDAFAPVGYLNLHKMHLEDKPECSGDWKSILADLPMKRSKQLLSELFTEEEHGVDSFDRQIPASPCPRCAVKSQEAQHILVRKIKNGQVWISGIVAHHSATSSVEQAATDCMDRLAEELTKSGLRPKDLVVMHLYVQDMSQFARINSVYKTYFGINPPARICVEAALPQNVVLQLDCMGCQGNIEPQTQRKTMHVQGLSHWAPANIGPYSQAVRLDEIVYIAGQIALCPATMAIIEGGIIAQSRLSLRHVQRVLQAMQSSANLHNIMGAICYVTHPSYIATAAKEWHNFLTKAQSEVEDLTQQCCPLVEYVVVPSLPRAALVEWQTWAFCSTRGKHERLQKSSNNWRITADYFSCGVDEEASFTARVRVDKDEHSRSTDDLATLLTTLCGVIQDMLRKVEVSTDVLGGMRIFYDVNNVHIDELAEAYEKAFCKWATTERSTSHVPSATFVPVLGFSSSTCIFSIFC